MNRRQFLGSAASLPLLAQTPANSSLIKPAALKPGDTVGLITPSTYVSDPDRLELARRTIEYLGLKPKFAKNVAHRAGYLGGSINERLDDLHAMFADPGVKAVFATRGGYGSGQLLDKIDYGLIRRNPKIFTGYSDITALHLAIHRSCGLVTFHAPTVLARFTDFTLDHFRRALFDPAPLGTLTNPPEAGQLRPRHTTRAIRPGKARGRLIGGNLSLVCATMGTPFEIQTDGCIVFLEDVEEQPYNIDRMLTQLRLAGKFRNIAGLIWGECSGCGPREYRPAFESTFSVGEVVQDILSGLTVPVFTGLTIGHTDDQLTLPLGVMASIDADAGALTIEESALSQ